MFFSSLHYKIFLQLLKKCIKQYAYDIFFSETCSAAAILDAVTLPMCISR